MRFQGQAAVAGSQSSNGVTRAPVAQPAQEVQRFLSQPFFVAEVFTGAPGQLVPLEDTIKSFNKRDRT